MTEFKKIDPNQSRTQQMSQLSDNDLVLDGRIYQREFADKELDQVYSDLSLTKQYYRGVPLGHTVTTYTGWSHYKAESGYSIWSFAVGDFKDDADNLLTQDHVKFTYQGVAESLASAGFTKVLNVYNGICYNFTTEAGTEGGTAFSFLQVADGLTCWLLLCASTTFSAIAFDLETVGGNYATKLSYWNGSNWGVWDGTCVTAGFVDNTDNFHYNGKIIFNIPSDWAQSAIDGTTGYWIKLRTTNTPTQIGYAYSIMPGTDVPTSLKLSEKQILDKDWAWCYYNGYAYVTLPNAGDAYYEGDTYIKSTSSTENKQAYFISNHEIKIWYEKQNYSSASAFVLGALKTATKNQLLQLSNQTLGTAYMVTDLGDGYSSAIALWNGASWVGFYASNFLIGM